MSVHAPTRPTGNDERNNMPIVMVNTSISTSRASASVKATRPESRSETLNSDSIVNNNRKLKGFSRAAHSILAMNGLQSGLRDSNTAVKNTLDVGQRSNESITKSAPKPRVSLAHMLKSRVLKKFVSTQQLSETPAILKKQSSVLADWVTLTTLRKQQEEDSIEDEDFGQDVQLDSDIRIDTTAKSPLYGRELILEEACRRALALDSEQRTEEDIQDLGRWFQATKLQIVTDFEHLKPSELELLCRRMTCVTYSPAETIFCQGDEGDALFIVFTGIVEVRVSQRFLGEVVEVTVCELGKGEFFGERSLLNNDVRAATVLSKTATELVRITRNDYNLMLKNDQLEFLSRMQLAKGIGVQRPAQRTQREYIKVLAKPKGARTKSEIDMLSEYLQTLKFFRTLSKSFIRELCEVVEFLGLPAGTCVFREGEVGDLFYIIFSGSVDVNVNSKDFKGNLQMTKLINLTEGSHFGELALMKGKGVRSATVITREKCQLLVICERDYNTTLRRMQKKDMVRRIGVLNQISMFQMPEWTDELLKELSYVLVEQKLTTGSVLYRQGDRASHVYFVVRGEVIVTKEIFDICTQVKHEVFVERIGRFRVVGDDAAAGLTFNEVISREVTVTASTPVELLFLSKHDVFHRLSLSARERLRAAAHSHAETIVYLDRLHKTQKWETYKHKVLHNHINHERIEKILPSATAHTRSPCSEKVSNLLHLGQSNLVQTSFEKAKPAFQQKRVESTISSNMKMLPVQRQALIPANDLLLLNPELKNPFRSYQTLNHYVKSFNADVPPSSARQHHLHSALVAEEHWRNQILKEGNPIASFDINVVDKCPKSIEFESVKDTTKLLDRREHSIMPHLPQPPSVVRPSCKSLTLTSQALNHLVQENFIFSRPTKRTTQDGNTQTVKPQQSMVTEVSKEVLKSEGETEPSKSFDDKIYVVFAIRDEDKETGIKFPSFQILPVLWTMSSLDEVAKQIRENFQLPNCKYFVLPINTFSLMPKASRSKLDEENFYLRLSGTGTHNNRSKKPLANLTNEKSLQSSSSESAVQFASFQELVILPLTCVHDHEAEVVIPGSTYKLESPVPSVNHSANYSSCRQTSHSARNAFAVASVVLWQAEVVNSQHVEPIVAVHALFASELDAATFAHTFSPLKYLKISMLCVFPLGKWIQLEHAQKYCVRVESCKQEKRSVKASEPFSSPNSRPLTRSPFQPQKPIWQQEREEAQSLHNIICTQILERKREQNGGLRSQPLNSLDDKLDALHIYLQTTAATPTRNKHGGSLLLKLRQAKRFDTMVRSSIARASVSNDTALLSPLPSVISE
ncbi:cAMP-regulated guanine nucleotide exchange factor [Plasmopara halstedii]|uniref:cAMP-regulated guanine nucleotide exchange factor n=1 Tax=Plasmopara halstedii TaxID=4781 RepID=A0A0P1B2C2_PLAHL|nr:cAMP-regulated guanine nucleotide exchange factor [Plasmopara halstedii]CEG48176.1 cAMP-regulated guanine nucleotide exchange factor [Plasmopara halstedii]|eukprot:XP_024584545.1 cAMP-regulated guanine nucleotide exchange factor [Plasmopara halstedii]